MDKVGIMVDALLSRDLEFVDMVPVDAQCIVTAIELGRAFQLRMLDAIHLAAFRMMPAECRFMTFDDRLSDAAREMDLNLLSPE